MHDWSRVEAGVYHSFRFLWIAAIIDRLNAGLLPPGMVAMAEQVIGGSKPDVTEFVIQLENERYASKANQMVIRYSLGKVVAVVEVVSSCNKDSRHALRSFVEKIVDLLYDNINLLIIDPFPPSPRDPQGIHKAIWDEITDELFELPSDRKLALAAHQDGVCRTVCGGQSDSRYVAILTE